jgi:hypothetical protein
LHALIVLLRVDVLGSGAERTHKGNSLHNICFRVPSLIPRRVPKWPLPFGAVNSAVFLVVCHRIDGFLIYFMSRVWIRGSDSHISGSSGDAK